MDFKVSQIKNGIQITVDGQLTIGRLDPQMKAPGWLDGVFSSIERHFDSPLSDDDKDALRKALK